MTPKVFGIGNSPEERAGRVWDEWFGSTGVEAHCQTESDHTMRSAIAAAIREAVGEEREACAVIADRGFGVRMSDAPDDAASNQCWRIAEAIRTREQK